MRATMAWMLLAAAGFGPPCFHESAFTCRPMPAKSSKHNRILGLLLSFIVAVLWHRPSSWRFNHSYSFCEAWSTGHSNQATILPSGRRFNYFRSTTNHNVMKVQRRDEGHRHDDDDVSSLLDVTLQGVVVAQCLHLFVKLRLAQCFLQEPHELQQHQETTASSSTSKNSSSSNKNNNNKRRSSIVRESDGSASEQVLESTSRVHGGSSSSSSSFTCCRRSIDYLAQCSSTHADRLLRILRVLSTKDIVQEHHDDDDNLTFSLSRKGQALFLLAPTNDTSSSSSQSTSMASSMIQYLLDGPIWNSWNFLTDYVLEEDTAATLSSSSTTTTTTTATTSGNDQDAIAVTVSRAGTPFERANNQLSTQEYYATNPMALHNANRFVGYMFDWETKELARHFFWDTVSSLVDIGGYRGGTILSIQAHHAHLVGHSYCVDLAGPILEEQAAIQKTNRVVENNNNNNNNNQTSLGGRKRMDDIVFRAADILKDDDCSTVLSSILLELEPNNQNLSSKALVAPFSRGTTNTTTNTTVFLLKHMILCEFNDAESLHVLQECHKALPDHGRVVIVESIIPDQQQQDRHSRPTTVSPAMVDVFLMMDGRPERSRSVSEWSDFVSRVGYEIDQVYPTSCPTCALLVLRKKI